MNDVRDAYLAKMAAAVEATDDEYPRPPQAVHVVDQMAALVRDELARHGVDPSNPDAAVGIVAGAKAVVHLLTTTGDLTDDDVSQGCIGGARIVAATLWRAGR